VLLVRNKIQRQVALFVFVSTLFGVDALARPWARLVLSRRSYYNVYWLTELMLVLAVFLLICAFFRQACRERREMWHFLRPTLGFVLLLVAAVSAITVGRNYEQLFSWTGFWEFTQNLYFACLVLNTILYLMLQWLGNQDDCLHLLVCGLGIQLGGLAASAALVHLTRKDGATSFFHYLSPICSLAMLTIWFYALSRERRTAHRQLPGPSRRVPVAA